GGARADDHDHHVVPAIERILPARRPPHRAIPLPELPDVPEKRKVARIVIAREFGELRRTEDEVPLGGGEEGLVGGTDVFGGSEWSSRRVIESSSGLTTCRLVDLSTHGHRSCRRKQERGRQNAPHRPNPSNVFADGSCSCRMRAPRSRKPCSPR